MKTWNRALAALALTVFSASFCLASQYPFVLSSKSPRDNVAILSLINSATGQSVWTRTVYGNYKVGWAIDHRALALTVNSPLWNSFRLLVWTAGRPVKLIAGPSAKKGWGNYENDGVLNFIWSTDDKRLLFRPWGSGEDIMNIASLYCLSTDDYSLHYIDDDVQKMKWIGNRGFNYWVVKLKQSGSTVTYVAVAKPKYGVI